VPHFQARHESSLQAQVVGSLAMVYSDGALSKEDRPPHVLAASGLSIFQEYLAVVQDDANWLALIDAEQRITAVPLPPGPDGQRVFTKRRGNQDYKCDLEACVALRGDRGPELIGFSSGSRADRDWVLRVRELAIGNGIDEPSEAGGPTLETELIRAPSFFDALRTQTEFSGSGLNIEGAVALDNDRIMLFQRGNAESKGTLQAVDATAELSWHDLRHFLEAPNSRKPPVLKKIKTYTLGELNGVRLTFSDAEHLGGGRLLYSASAEDPETGAVAGSVLGLIEADGNAYWTELLDTDGGNFAGKIEGLTRDVTDPSLIHFVIDDDDDEVPSKVYRARIGARFLKPPVVSWYPS
jgi:hypothetical protein